MTAKFKGTPSVAYNPGTHALELFALGTDNAVWHNYIQNGTAWEGWSVMDAGSKFTATPTAVYDAGMSSLELFDLGTDNSIWHATYHAGWSSWSQLGAGPHAIL
ncbi:hypothetical protein [Embleya sp. NPDC005971]|uniref:hypothetical protein n=1 Tax=Embleya sp. NPDC005971 TaxID=3156724 RepID=UPI0034071111